MAGAVRRACHAVTPYGASTPFRCVDVGMVRRGGWCGVAPRMARFRGMRRRAPTMACPHAARLGKGNPARTAPVLTNTTVTNPVTPRPTPAQHPAPKGYSYRYSNSNLPDHTAIEYNSSNGTTMSCSLCGSALTVRLFTPSGTVCSTCYQRVVMFAAPTVRLLPVGPVLVPPSPAPAPQHHPTPTPDPHAA